MMIWLKSLIEIKDSRFLKNTYLANVNSETIKGYLDFISNLEENLDIAKVIYPDVCYYLLEFEKLFQQIYENKLAVEEAEKLFRKKDL
jgi:hypothetical protein